MYDQDAQPYDMIFGRRTPIPTSCSNLLRLKISTHTENISYSAQRHPQGPDGHIEFDKAQSDKNLRRTQESR